MLIRSIVRLRKQRNCKHRYRVVGLDSDPEYALVKCTQCEKQTRKAIKAFDSIEMHAYKNRKEQQND